MVEPSCSTLSLNDALILPVVAFLPNNSKYINLNDAANVKYSVPAEVDSNCTSPIDVGIQSIYFICLVWLL